MSAIKMTKDELIQQEFPSVKIRKEGNLSKFNVDSLDSSDLIGLAKFNNLYFVNIKRSGKGLVIIIE